jgi:hypothetical protein
MQLPNLKDMLLGDKKVVFLRYQDQALWYRAENGFEFPVPVSDTGMGIFLPEDKALVFQRWIRKHLDFLKMAVDAQTSLPL